MRRMKKAAAALTAAALVATLAVPVWAENNAEITNETVDKKAEIPVTATYDPATVYHVDITWNSMDFIYEPGIWTPEASNSKESLTYSKENGKTVGWNDYDSSNSNKASHNITVTNKSNDDIHVKFAFAPIENEKDRVDALFYAESKNLKIESDKGIWMQRADANVDGLHGKANITEGADTEATKQGKQVDAVIDLYLFGRPRYTYTSGSKTTIGTVTITIAGADNRNPGENSSTYSNTYYQSEN